ncbi:MAG TPA: HD domain-containing phosphohydrolase [Planctomycetota bacterium]|nr:HD domain-containing phosphohydrolase [Planctomycetota bacterium]
MIPALDLDTFRSAEEVFRALGAAAGSLQTYGDGHPRFVESIQRTLAALLDYFKRDPETPHITFLLTGRQAEFRGIPLLRGGPQGARILKVLKSRGLGGLQIRRGITLVNVAALIRDLAGIEEPSPGSKVPAALPASDSAPAENPAKDRAFSVMAMEEAQRFDRSRGASRGTAEADQFLVPEFYVLEGTVQSLLSTYKTILARPEEALALSRDLLEETVNQTIALMAPVNGSAPASISGEYFDDFTFHHSVNVCLIATTVAGAVLKDPRVLRRISMAALLHDVGKSRIPEEILQKPGRLTPGEFEVLQAHPVHGAEILLGVKDLDPICVPVAFGHHCVYGRAPYPKTRKPYAGDWITRLVSIVDIYEALTAVRPYKRGLAPETALEVMLSMPGLEKDIDLVKLLYDSLGPYPAGSVVELTTGERAAVLGRNPVDPRLPRVRIFTDPARNILEAPVELDLAGPANVRDGHRMSRVARTIVCQSIAESPWSDEPSPEPTDVLGAPLNDDQTLMAREG